MRNNNGGFVNVYAIDVFARRGYFNMLSRGFPSVSSRTLLGQRALELPTILVTNQHSLSDAEDFTEGYRTLKLGKVVGEPTAGWIIYTGGITLIDGSVLRMPATKIFASDGTPMEMHPRPVDVPVTRPVGESYSGKDVQLDTAVAELLKQIGAGTETEGGTSKYALDARTFAFATSDVIERYSLHHPESDREQEKPDRAAPEADGLEQERSGG